MGVTRHHNLERAMCTCSLLRKSKPKQETSLAQAVLSDLMCVALGKRVPADCQYVRHLVGWPPSWLHGCTQSGKPHMCSPMLWQSAVLASVVDNMAV